MLIGHLCKTRYIAFNKIKQNDKMHFFSISLEFVLFLCIAFTPFYSASSFVSSSKFNQIFSLQVNRVSVVTELMGTRSLLSYSCTATLRVVFVR